MRLGSVGEGAVSHALERDPIGVDIGDAQFGLEVEALAFGHQLAEFVDHPLPVPGKVGGAFAVPAC